MGSESGNRDTEIAAGTLPMAPVSFREPLLTDVSGEGSLAYRGPTGPAVLYVAGGFWMFYRFTVLEDEHLTEGLDVTEDDQMFSRMNINHESLMRVEDAS